MEAVAEVDVGRVAGRAVVVGVRDDVVGVPAAGFAAGRAVVEVVEVEAAPGRVVVDLVVPATLDRRSNPAVVVDGFVGARVEGVPASDMRLAVPEMPFFSSLELATERPFSSAELPLTEARERCDAVLGAFRAVDAVVVVGRVGGLLRVLLLVGRVLLAVVLVGRLEAVVVPDTGRLVVAVVVLDGDLTFSLFSLPSGLVTGPSLADIPDSTGVAGVSSTGPSVEAILCFLLAWFAEKPPVPGPFPGLFSSHPQRKARLLSSSSSSSFCLFFWFLLVFLLLLLFPSPTDVDKPGPWNGGELETNNQQPTTKKTYRNIKRPKRTRLGN